MTIDSRHLLTLLTWMSPAFPAGSFACSHGLEWAIEEGVVQSPDDLRLWIADLITRGSGWNDAVLFARCWEDSAPELNQLALALASSKERQFETAQLGASFAIAAEAFLPSPLAGEGPAKPGIRGPVHVAGAPSSGAARHLLPQGEEEEIAYPIAAGLACARLGIARSHALPAFLQGFSNSLVSVAVRLVPLGQTRGLEVIRDLMPVIAATAVRAGTATLDDLGSITILSDIAAMNHETQHSRVFRT